MADGEAQGNRNAVKHCSCVPMSFLGKPITVMSSQNGPVWHGTTCKAHMAYASTLL